MFLVLSVQEEAAAQRRSFFITEGRNTVHYFIMSGVKQSSKQSIYCLCAPPPPFLALILSLFSSLSHRYTLLSFSPAISPSLSLSLCLCVETVRDGERERENEKVHKRNGDKTKR